MRLATQLGARDLSSIEMGAAYAEAGASEVAALQSLGRNDEARRVGEDAVALADKVLERRPGYRLALHAQQVIEISLTGVAQNDLNPAEAIRIATRAVQISRALLNLDPNSTDNAGNLAFALQGLGDSLWAAARLREAVPRYMQALDDYAKASAGGTGLTILYGAMIVFAVGDQVRSGDPAGAAATLLQVSPVLRKLRQSEPQGSMAPVIVDALDKYGAADVALERDDYVHAQRNAWDAVKELEVIKPLGGQQEVEKYVSLFVAADVAGQADYLLGDFAAAERAERTAVEARKHYLTDAVNDRRDAAEKATWLAMALAREGHIDEAAQVIAPVVKFQRELAARNHGDRWQPVELARALFAQALTDKTRSTALLREAAALLDATPPAIRNLHDIKQWRERVRSARSAAQVRGAG